jgi:YVTN family beta-propeller protein
MKIRARFARLMVLFALVGSIALFYRPWILGARAAGADVVRVPSTPAPGGPDAAGAEPHRSPISLAICGDGSRLLVANQTAGSVSLVDPRSGKVLHELATGEKPAGVAISRDGRKGAVTHWYGYDVAVLDLSGDRIKLVDRIAVGPEPRGVVMTPDAKFVYIAVGVTNEVVRIDVESRKVTGRLKVGREPRGLAVSPDGTLLLSSNARSQDVSIIDAKGWKVLSALPIQGDNLRQISFAADGKSAYLANMKNRGFPTTRNNIDLGWVLGQRLTRIELDAGVPEFSTISLDPQGKAASDAHGAAVSPDLKWIAVSLGGTHEVMIFRTDKKPLPWRSNSSRDLLAPDLLKPDGRLRRVDLGGRPTELAFSPDSKTLFVANYLNDSIQAIDTATATLTKEISLGGPRQLSLARRGEILFHDAGRSFNQWYSCNTCHSDGHTNGIDFDTLNDGSQDRSTFHRRSRKTVPTLRRVTRTGPWTWHGWQSSLDDAMVESFTKSMQGKTPSSDEVKALIAYLGTLDYPRNPNRNPDGSLTAAAVRGEQVFKSKQAGCNSCHSGPEFTDGKIHVVGLEEPDDAYRGYNPPSLRGLYDRDPYLHDGRSKTLRDALSGPHSPESLGGGELTSHQLDDLIAYLRSL